MQKPKVIIIVGTTASGKSALAVELAKKFKGEVISADSRQIYRKLDIGTAKITPSEMQGIPHHLIDIIDIDTRYTVADFKRDAQQAIAEIVDRGNTPIITGGTFFYIDALLERTSVPEVAPNEALRSELEALSANELHDRLANADSRRAATIDGHNKRRLIRALEIVEALGSVPETKLSESPYDALLLGITANKAELRKKFEERAHTWLSDGFEDEVRALLQDGVPKDRLAEMGFEYQLCMELIDGAFSKTEFIQKFVEKNWRYAKRQITWLKRDKSINWVAADAHNEIDTLIKHFLLN